MNCHSNIHRRPAIQHTDIYNKDASYILDVTLYFLLIDNFDI